jgi:hypothetical protein
LAHYFRKPTDSLRSFYYEKFQKLGWKFFDFNSQKKKKKNPRGYETRGVSHCVWPCHLHLKRYLKAKEEELWKLKYFTMQKYHLQKIL